MKVQQEYFSLKETATLLGMAHSTIKKWVYVTNKIEAVKVGDSVRIHKDEIERIITPMEREIKMNNLQVFNNNEFGEIRTAKVDGNPYLMLADVCRILDIKNVSDVKSRLNDKGIATTDTLTNGGIQQATFINEANFYKVVFQSRKPQAEQFTDWVTSEVLPSIRETGIYSNNGSILEGLHKFNGQVIEELNGVNARISRLEDDTIVNSRQVKKIKDKANSKAVQVLGGKDSMQYKDRSIRSTVYANLWNDYKDYLGLTSYADTRKIDFEKGIDFIGNWQPNGRTMRILEI